MHISHLLLIREVCNVKPTYRKSWVGNLLMWSHLTLDPSFIVKRQPNLKMRITSGILILCVFYYCFYMIAMFGDTPPDRNTASSISLVEKSVCNKSLSGRTNYHISSNKICCYLEVEINDTNYLKCLKIYFLKSLLGIAI